MRTICAGMLAVGCILCGCSSGEATPAVEVSAAAGSQHGHSHDGWWCPEHGVPEDVCGLCDPKVAARMQADGDWCREHDRPDTQCFACHPEAQARYAALYEAKYGEQPPAME